MEEERDLLSSLPYLYLSYCLLGSTTRARDQEAPGLLLIAQDSQQPEVSTNKELVKQSIAPHGMGHTRRFINKNEAALNAVMWNNAQNKLSGVRKAAKRPEAATFVFFFHS